jgi:DNA-binding MarR family transcriptional regulator
MARLAPPMQPSTRHLSLPDILWPAEHAGESEATAMKTATSVAGSEGSSVSTAVAHRAGPNSTVNAAANDDGSGPTLLYLVGRIDRVVRRSIDDVVKAQGLSVSQYTTLSVLDRRSGLSNAQLARRALVSPQSMNEVLLTLEQRGLVRRRAHPEHGRILQTRLTAKGRKVLAACDAKVRAVEARMISDLSAEQRLALREGLLRGVQSLQDGLEGD